LVDTAVTSAVELSAEQQAVVEWGDGPLMVLAGAGTGKTTVVVERVRHLLATEAGLQPENVLVLTYNVRAAAELSRRLEERLGLETATRLAVHNFHAFGNRILSEHRSEAGLGDSTDVLDPIGQRLLLRDLRSAFAGFVYHSVALGWPWTANRFAELIGRAKDELITPEEYLAYARAKREAFDFRFGTDTFGEALEDIRTRQAQGAARGIRDTRAALRAGADEAGRVAYREARREVTGGGFASAWGDLTAEQQRLAQGLKQTFLRDAEAFEVLRLTEEAEAYAVYQRALRDRGLMDFGEQQLRAIQLLTERPNICRHYQARFRHVLVDEFQDANVAQILLLELIGRGPDKPDNVVVVGDDDQSIYRFRGASYAAFAEFRDRFEQAPRWAPARPAGSVARLPLLANRRSGASILSAAQRLIEHNPGRLKPEPLEATRPAGEPVDLIVAVDEGDEADAVVSGIRDAYAALPERIIRPDGTTRQRRWSDIAVLYRKHRHREEIVDRLRKQDIPFVVVGGTGLFAQPDVRDVEAALRVIADPSDSVALVRLLSAGPWRLDATEILRLTRAADWDGRPVYHAATEVVRDGAITVPEVEVVSPAAEDPGPGLTLWASDELSPAGTGASPGPRPPRTREQRSAWRREQLDARLRARLQRVLGVLDPLVPRARRDGPFELLEEYLVRTNLLHDLIATGTPEAQRSVLGVARLMRLVSDWQRSHPRGSLSEFVVWLDMYQQVGGDLESEVQGRVELEGVQLMTVYQAKGLEYEVVIVPRMVEEQFPDLRGESQMIPVDLLKQTPPEEFAIAEERRLAFVAMTRARTRLVLTGIDSPDGRIRASRFIEEVMDDRHTGKTPGVRLERRTAPVEAGVESSGQAGATERTDTTAGLLRLMPVPLAQQRRFELRRKAVELIGALEALEADDGDARSALTAELVAVAEEAASVADEARRNGVDPVTFSVLSRHSPAGRTLLELAPVPATLSHSQLESYLGCPLQYALARIYRIPVDDTKGFLEFGHSIHAAFERYAVARREARAGGAPDPGYDALKAAFDAVWQPRAYQDMQAARHYEERAEPALRRFYERELKRDAEAVDFEVPFAVHLGEGVRFTGYIDRIDRHPDGSIEIIDYKTGKAKHQRAVDEDGQLTGYALALAMGAVDDPVTRVPLPAASRLTLYFTETDQALSTTRTDEQLGAFRTLLLDTARRIRAGDFAATPGERQCRWCDYRRICPTRWGDPRT
jgi:superfamily I DNA/RNA helicase/RecB family exonuclease